MAKEIPTAELDPDAGWHADADSAALRATQNIGKGAEQAGVLYQNRADKQFSSSKPVGQGERDGFALKAKAQPGHTIAGIFHNHPGDDDNGQVFSPRDIQVAEQLKVPSYIYFEKTGTVRKYVPGQTVTRSIPDPVTPRNWVKVSDGDPVTSDPDNPSTATLAPNSPPPLITGQQLSGDTMSGTSSPTANSPSGTSLDSLYTQNPGTVNATAGQAAAPTPVTAQTATAGQANGSGLLSQAQQYTAAQNTVGSDQLASNQLAKITSEDSPLMEQAKQEGLNTANSRGLLNSTLAGGAAEAEMVKAATPLAEQNAATEANSSLANQAATNQAAAQNASLGTQVSQSNTAVQAQIASLNAQMQTAVSQGNAQQANALAEQLQQLQTQTSQFNAAQTTAVNQQNTQEANAMTSQVLQSNSDFNKQFLAGTQSMDLATIQGRYQNLIAQNSAASSLFNSYMQSISATMANTNLDPSRAAQIVQIQQQTLASGLALMDAMNNLDPSGGANSTATPSSPTSGVLSAGAAATGYAPPTMTIPQNPTPLPSTAGGEAASAGSPAQAAIGVGGLLGSALGTSFPGATAAGQAAYQGAAAIPSGGVTGSPNDVTNAATNSSNGLFNSPAAALGTAGSLYGIASGIRSGTPLGDAKAAVGAANLASKAGILPTGGSTGAALGAAGSVLGLYSGLKQGGVGGDTEAALSAANLGVQAASASGAISAGTTAMLSGALGAFSLFAAPVIMGMTTQAVELTPKYWNNYANSLQKTIDSGDKGQMAGQISGLLATPQNQVPPDVQEKVFEILKTIGAPMQWGLPTQTDAQQRALQSQGAQMSSESTHQDSRM